jgi:hypothetical protein
MGMILGAFKRSFVLRRNYFSFSLTYLIVIMATTQGQGLHASSYFLLTTTL